MGNEQMEMLVQFRGLVRRSDIKFAATALAW